MAEIMVVWELDPLCHLPGDQIEKAVRVVRELGHSFHWSASQGVLLVNSPFAGRQIALIVEEGKQDAALGLADAVQKLLVDTGARINLVRLADHPVTLPLGGHVLLWLAEGAEYSPLAIVPGKFYGSARLASLLYEELGSAARLTPGTDVLFLEAPRKTCPSSMPAAVIECPPATAGVLQHWAAAVKQGLARHFNGEGTSLSGCQPSASAGREEMVPAFWRRLQQEVPLARLTAAAKSIFKLDGTPRVAVPAPVPATSFQTESSPNGPQRTGTARPAPSQIMGRPGTVPPASLRWNPRAAVPRAPAPGFRYPASPYPVTMAPFVRPVEPWRQQVTQSFSRSGPDSAPPAGDKPAEESAPPPAWPLR